MPFNLPDLPYAKDALEPSIDAQTMELHHSVHHAGYTKKLNAAIEGTAWDGKPIEEILASLSSLPQEIRTAVRNNGGGYYNHALFWPIMAAKGKGGSPAGELKAAIDNAFQSFDRFKESLSDAAANRFGSGWAWLIVKHSDGKLAVTSTPNQDNPLMRDVVDLVGTPILGIDVWEHAYYLRYGPKRPDYIAAWWDIVNWQKVGENYAAAKK